MWPVVPVHEKRIPSTPYYPVSRASVKRRLNNPRAIAYLNLGELGCHDLGVFDKVVFMTYRTAIPKTIRPWHPNLNKAIAL